MAENSFKFKKGDLELEFSGERNFVEEQIKNWMDFIERNYSQTDKAEKVINMNPEIETKNLNIKVKKNISIKDFLKLKAPENEADKIIVAAYYLERYEKFNSFTEKDIINLVKIDDAERLLAINMEKGFLSQIKDEKKISGYTLTYSGEIYVREGLQE